MRLYSLFSPVGFSNTYLLGPEGGGDAILIDPGVFNAAMLQAVEDNHLYVRSILVTHTHNAHTNGIRSLLKVYDARIYARQPSVLDVPATSIADGDTLALGGIEVRVIGTPGHSIDSLCFLIDQML
ncbi:MAG TPA: MBL fold metallo-hydrolase, partial [Spirochaetia bacterium]